MRNKIKEEKPVGLRTVRGQVLEIWRIEWEDGRFSYDVYAKATDDLLTMDESFDNYPDTDQLVSLIENDK